MRIEISGNSRCIKIVFDGKLVALNKQQVKSIDMIGSDKVRIDMGEGALNHIYINAADVAVPNKFVDAASLLDYFVDLWVKGLDCCNDTKARMDAQVRELVSINTVLQDIKAELKPVINPPSDPNPAPDVFANPLLSDITEPGIVYNGYANAGALLNAPAWAIQKQVVQGNSTIELWANGSKNLTSIWNNRKALTYLPLSLATS